AARADRVPKRNRSAVDVQLSRIDPELAGDCNGLNRERLVQLDQVYLGQIPPSTLQRLLNCSHRSHHYQLRLNAARSLRNYSRKRLASDLTRNLGGRYDHGSSAVVHTGRVAGSDGSAFFECRLQSREHLERRVLARTFVGSN